MTWTAIGELCRDVIERMKLQGTGRAAVVNQRSAPPGHSDRHGDASPGWNENDAEPGARPSVKSRGKPRPGGKRFGVAYDARVSAALPFGKLVVEGHLCSPREFAGIQIGGMGEFGG